MNQTAHVLVTHQTLPGASTQHPWGILGPLTLQQIAEISYVCWDAGMGAYDTYGDPSGFVLKKDKAVEAGCR